MTITITDRISLLTANQDEITELTRPYFIKLDANELLTIEEQRKFDSLLKIYGDLNDEIYNLTRVMNRRRKSFVKKLFSKN